MRQAPFTCSSYSRALRVQGGSSHYETACICGIACIVLLTINGQWVQSSTVYEEHNIRLQPPDTIDACTFAYNRAISCWQQDYFALWIQFVWHIALQLPWDFWMYSGPADAEELYTIITVHSTRFVPIQCNACRWCELYFLPLFISQWWVCVFEQQCDICNTKSFVQITLSLFRPLNYLFAKQLSSLRSWHHRHLEISNENVSYNNDSILYVATKILWIFS